MTTITTQWIALDEVNFCSFEELRAISGLSELELAELVDVGAIVAHHDATAPVFALRYVAVAGTARRLRDDFELDHRGIALAMMLLTRIEALQAQLALARTNTPG